MDEETTRRPLPPGDEQKGAAEWIAASSAAVSTITQLYQTVKKPRKNPPPTGTRE